MVALLRGINVGGHRRVPMAALRALCGRLGLRDAATFIQSGNVVFAAALRAPAAAARLERGIEGAFGFRVDLVVRTAAEWEGLVAANPFRAAAEREPDRVMLVLSTGPLREGCAPGIAARGAAGEEAAEAGGALWIRYPAGAGSSRVSPAVIDRLAGSPCTARNWRTVLALAAMLRGEPGREAAPRRTATSGASARRGGGGRGRRR